MVSGCLEEGEKGGSYGMIVRFGGEGLTRERFVDCRY